MRCTTCGQDLQLPYERRTYCAACSPVFGAAVHHAGHEPSDTNLEDMRFSDLVTRLGTPSLKITRREGEWCVALATPHGGVAFTAPRALLAALYDALSPTFPPERPVCECPECASDLESALPAIAEEAPEPWLDGALRVVSELRSPALEYVACAILREAFRRGLGEPRELSTNPEWICIAWGNAAQGRDRVSVCIENEGCFWWCSRGRGAVFTGAQSAYDAAQPVLSFVPPEFWAALDELSAKAPR